MTNHKYQNKIIYSQHIDEPLSYARSITFQIEYLYVKYKCNDIGDSIFLIMLFSMTPHMV